MAVKRCESGGSYSTNTGNGYYGAGSSTRQLATASGGSLCHRDQARRAQDQVTHNYLLAGWDPGRARSRPSPFEGPHR
jgi:hypothetical protein